MHTTSTTFTHGKTQLRRQLLAQRQAVPAATRAAWDAAIAGHLEAWFERQPARVIGVFWPMRSEPDLRDLYASWAAAEVRLALPMVIDKDAPLKFLAWTPGDTLVKDAMGVWVPARCSAEVLPEALLIPCVGFNAARFRLGYGGGFYDRTLASAQRPWAIGVAHACSRAEFAVEDHDIALDAMVTEAGLLA